MNTIVTEDPLVAASYVTSGDLAAFPTETVYGLGADALNLEAVRGVFRAKGRPSDNPLIIHIGDRDLLPMVAGRLSDAALALMDRFFPGPLTLVLPKAERVPDVVTAGLNTVGVREPSHPVARSFLNACGRPVAAPSANRSGRPSPTTWEAVLEDLDGCVPCVLKGGRSPVGLESTVVDCARDVPVVLRAGAVSIERLRAVVPETRAFDTEEGQPARSPGMRHRHYAPRAVVTLVDAAPRDPSDNAAFIGLDAPSSPEAYVLVQTAATLDAYAHELFNFMRRCDAAGIRVLYCQRVSPEGIGTAIMDRVGRASEG